MLHNSLNPGYDMQLPFIIRYSSLSWTLGPVEEVKELRILDEQVGRAHGDEVEGTPRELKRGRSMALRRKSSAFVV